MLTSNNYLLSIKQLVAKCDEAAKSKEARKLDAQLRKKRLNKEDVLDALQRKSKEIRRRLQK